MNRDDIIRMARAAGPLISTPFDEWCERFAALVTAEKDAEIERLRVKVSKWQTLAQVHAPSMEFQEAHEAIEKKRSSLGGFGHACIDI